MANTFKQEAISQTWSSPFYFLEIWEFPYYITAPPETKGLSFLASIGHLNWQLFITVCKILFYWGHCLIGSDDGVVIRWVMLPGLAWLMLHATYCCSFFPIVVIKHHDQATYKTRGLFGLMVLEG